MALKPLIIGSTGMIGKGLFVECLEDPSIEQILTLNRNPVDIQHNKLLEIIHKDLNKLTD